MLVGREQELARISELVSAAGDGRGGALVLWGEPGIGKSALLAYAREHAGEAMVLSTRGVQAESELPFSGLSELLAPVVDHLEAIPGPQRAALEGALALGPPVLGDRFAAYVGVLSLMSAAAEEAPLLVLVDDAHWLDSASTEALLFVVRRLLDERIAVLFAVRHGEASRFDEHDVPELRLEGLDKQAADALLRASHVREETSAVAERLWQATAGNPLALLELPSVLPEDQLEGREPLEEPLPLIPSLKAVYERSVEDLPELTRRALTIAAANDTGSQREIMLAVEAQGLPSDVLSPAEIDGLISLSGERIEFRHPMLRSAAYHGSSGPERRAAHDALSQVLASDPSPARRAWHRAAAALSPDEEVARELEHAANDALGRGAPTAAASAREVAARLSPEIGARARRLQEAGRDAWLSGRSGEAARLLEEALEQGHDPVFLAETKHLRGQVEVFAQSILAGRRLFLEGADAVLAHDPTRAAEMRADASFTLVMEGRPRAAREAAEEARALARGAGSAVHLPSALALHAALTLCGETESALEIGEEARFLLEAEPPLGNHPLVAGLGFTWACLEREEEGREIVRGVVERARAMGALAILPHALSTLCFIEFLLGNWAVAYASGTESVRLAEETGQRSQLADSLAHLTHVEAGRGSEVCRAHAREAIETAEESGADSILHIVSASLGHLELGLDRFEEAARELERADGSSKGLRQPTVLRSAGDLVEAHFRAGDTASSERALANLEEEAELTKGRWAHAVAARCRGLIASDSEFEDHFEDALRRHRGAASPFSRARTQLSYGARLRRSRRRSDAREHLLEALETFESLGARPWAEKAARELAATGERVERASSEAERLTAQELQVALAVSKGATNKDVAASLFISPRTVNAHLNRIYSKLGIHSRAELTRVVLEGGLPS